MWTCLCDYITMDDVNGPMWSGWSRTKIRQRRKINANTLLAFASGRVKLPVGLCEVVELVKNEIKEKDGCKHAAFVCCWWRLIWNITSFIFTFLSSFSYLFYKKKFTRNLWKIPLLTLKKICLFIPFRFLLKILFNLIIL